MPPRCHACTLCGVPEACRRRFLRQSRARLLLLSPSFESEAALETDHDPLQRQILLIHKDMLSAMSLQFTSPVFVTDAAAECGFSVLFGDEKITGCHRSGRTFQQEHIPFHDAHSGHIGAFDTHGKDVFFSDRAVENFCIANHLGALFRSADRDGLRSGGH